MIIQKIRELGETMKCLLSDLFFMVYVCNKNVVINLKRGQSNKQKNEVFDKLTTNI